MIGYKKHDGGRAEAGYKGTTGDCVVRATAIALHHGQPTGKDYHRLYQVLAEAHHGVRGVRSCRHGVAKKAYYPVLEALGFERIPLTSKAHGGKWLTFTEAWERYQRSMMVQKAKHVLAIVDGVMLDTYDWRRYVWEGDFGDEIRERKTPTVWLAPVRENA